MNTTRCYICPVEHWQQLATAEVEGYHPADVLLLGLEGKGVPIAGVRQAQTFVSETPVGAVRKVIIAAVESMSLPAANALLKLLEEPPIYAEIVLFAASQKILPTIRSRVILQISSIDDSYLRAIRLLESQPDLAHQATYLLPLLHNTVSKGVVLEGIFQQHE